MASVRLDQAMTEAHILLAQARKNLQEAWKLLNQARAALKGKR
jgi:hypothetical protein